MFQRTAAQGWWHTVTPLLYGYEQCQPGHRFGPAVRQHFLLHYVLEGAGYFQKDGQTVSLQKGDLFVILPGEVTTYWADMDRPWQYAWIGFYAESTPRFLKDAVIRQPQVQRCFERIRHWQADAYTDGELFALVFEVLRILQLHTPANIPETNFYAARTITYLQTSYMYPISIQELAESLHIDRHYLTKLFRSSYGMSPQAYLTQLRLERARTFLQQGYGVSETAAMVGFSDLSNFSRRYKAQFGIPPCRQK